MHRDKIDNATDAGISGITCTVSEISSTIFLSTGGRHPTGNGGGALLRFNGVG